MAGVTDKAFRGICASFGAGFTYTEMVSAKGIKYGNEKTKDLIDISREEGRAGMQLFGSDPMILAETAKQVCGMYGDKIAAIDINMGCPAQKIVKNGEGCALMLNPALAGSIIKSVKKAVTIPVTVKFRKGWDDKGANALEFAKMAEDSGADAVTVHARTRDQFYRGKADLDVIAQVKSVLKIPVIGNGDIFSAPDALNMLEYTKCDAVMVARGALGNPFIFREILAARKGETPVPAGLEEKIAAALKHLRLAVENKGEKRAAREFRKHAAWYLKGVKNASDIRQRIQKAATQKEYENIFDACITGLNNLP